MKLYLTNFSSKSSRPGRAVTGDSAYFSHYAG